jgi:hypothetical protein
MAYDAANGVVLMVGGAAKGQVALFDIWIYDAGLDTWTPLPAAAPRGTNTDAGNNLIYDTRNRVFLLKSSVDLKNVWAFRYSPSSTRSEIGPATPRSRAWGVRLAALQNAQESRLRLPLETWVARPLPGIGRGPTPGQHQPTATATAAAPPDFGAPQGVVRR